MEYHFVSEVFASSSSFSTFCVSWIVFACLLIRCALSCVITGLLLLLCYSWFVGSSVGVRVCRFVCFVIPFSSWTDLTPDRYIAPQTNEYFNVLNVPSSNRNGKTCDYLNVHIGGCDGGSAVCTRALTSLNQLMWLMWPAISKSVI